MWIEPPSIEQIQGVEGEGQVGEHRLCGRYCVGRGCQEKMAGCRGSGGGRQAKAVAKALTPGRG